MLVLPTQLTETTLAKGSSAGKEAEFARQLKAERRRWSCWPAEMGEAVSMFIHRKRSNERLAAAQCRRPTGLHGDRVRARARAST